MANLLDRKGVPIGDFTLQVALGCYPGITVQHIAGASYGIPANGPFTLWQNNTMYTWPSSAGAVNSMALASGSTDDADGGIGVNKVKVFGLNNDFEPVTEVVSMNGQTPVKLTVEMAHVNHIGAYEIGTTGHNVGDVWLGSGTFTTGVPSSRYSLIIDEMNCSEVGVYTVPVSHSLLLYKPSATFGFYDAKLAVGVHVQPYRSKAPFLHEFFSFSNPTNNTLNPVPVLVAAKSKIMIIVNSCSATPDIHIEGESFLIEDAFFTDQTRR